MDRYYKNIENKKNNIDYNIKEINDVKSYYDVISITIIWVGVDRLNFVQII